MSNKDDQIAEQLLEQTVKHHLFPRSELLFDESIFIDTPVWYTPILPIIAREHVVTHAERIDDAAQEQNC